MPTALNERECIGQRGGENTGKFRDALAQVREEGTLSGLVIFVLAEWDLCGEHVLGCESSIHVLQLPQRLNQKARANQ